MGQETERCLVLLLSMSRLPRHLRTPLDLDWRSPLLQKWKESKNKNKLCNKKWHNINVFSCLKQELHLLLQSNKYSYFFSFSVFSCSRCLSVAALNIGGHCGKLFSMWANTITAVRLVHVICSICSHLFSNFTLLWCNHNLCHVLTKTKQWLSCWSHPYTPRSNCPLSFDE